MSEGKGNGVVNGRDRFRVLFRGIRALSHGWFDVEGKNIYDYFDFFIADILNQGLSVTEITLDMDRDDDDDDDDVIQDDDDDDDDDDQEEEEEESESVGEIEVGVKENILEPFCEPLMSFLGQCSTYRINSSLFFVGNSLTPATEILDSIDKSDYGGQSIRCLKSLSRIDLDSDDNNSFPQWIPATHPQVFGSYFESAAFGHNIYFFNKVLPTSCLLYDTLANTWSSINPSLPSHLEQSLVSPSLIADPDRDRILVHLSFPTRQTPALFAWNPKSPSWSPVIPSLPHGSWRKRGTLVDGLLFFYYYRKTSALFKVYDLATNQWLKIKWRGSIPDFLKRRYKAKSMFYMGNGKLCVAMSFHVPRPVFGSSVYFVSFHFSLSKNGRTIFISYTSMKLFYTRHISNTMDFVPLGDVC